MEILAKVLKPKDGGGATAGSSTSADEEQRFLKSLLALRSRDEIARGIRDRLSVLSVLAGEAPSEAVAPQATAAREGAPGAPAATAEDSGRRGVSVRPARSLRGVLERLQDGDASGLSPRLLERDFWNALVPELSTAAAETAPPPSAPWHLATAAAATAAATAAAAAAAAAAAVLSPRLVRPAAVTAAAAVAATAAAARASCGPGAAALLGARLGAMLGAEGGGGVEELQLPQGALGQLRTALRERGYGAAQPCPVQGWGAAQASLVALELGARRLAALGYPPVFIFAFDEAWAVLD